MEHDACGIGAVVSIDGEKSRAIVDQALKIVEKLEHRAGRDADGSTGDGVGLMTQIPHAFFRAQPLSFELPGERDYGVAMLFLSPDRLKRAQARKLMEIVVQKEGLRFLGWREVPVNAGVLGERARACMPVIEQAFIARPEDTARGLDFDRRLYTARRIFEQSKAPTATSAPCPAEPSSTRACSSSPSCGRSIPICRAGSSSAPSPWCAPASSTNTFPSWETRPSEPAEFCTMARSTPSAAMWISMIAREETLSSPVMLGDMDKVLPVIQGEGSDSAMLDNTLEFLMMNGVPLLAGGDDDHSRAVAERARRLPHPPGSVSLLRHQSMEPWDGPAAILFSDGDVDGRGAGPRRPAPPARYYVTDDRMLILASEVGVLDIPPEKILRKSRVRSGQDAAGGHGAKAHHRRRRAGRSPALRAGPTANGWTAICSR